MFLDLSNSFIIGGEFFVGFFVMVVVVGLFFMCLCWLGIVIRVENVVRVIFSGCFRGVDY